MLQGERMERERYEVKRSAELLSLWFRGGCRGNINRALDEAGINRVRPERDLFGVDRWADDGGRAP